VVKFKRGKPFWGMLLILTFTCGIVYIFGICSFDFDEGGHEEDTHHSFVHCGVDLTNFVLSENASSSLVNLTSGWYLYPQMTELRLPILSFSIFKIPKPT
jgi:hypothetical protein